MDDTVKMIHFLCFELRQIFKHVVEAIFVCTSIFFKQISCWDLRMDNGKAVKRVNAGVLRRHGLLLLHLSNYGLDIFWCLTLIFSMMGLTKSFSVVFISMDLSHVMNEWSSAKVCFGTEATSLCSSFLNSAGSPGSSSSRTVLDHISLQVDLRIC